MSSVNNTADVPPQESLRAQFNPSMAIIVVVLIGACLLVAILSIYIKRCSQRDDAISAGALARRNQSVHFFDRPGGGLERPVLDSLPMVSFSVVKSLKNGKEDFECAVCLESFEEDESLRLLPKCSHVFHTECIDAWFQTHSTCPLCRTSLKPTTEELDAGIPTIGEVSRRILEAQEEISGSPWGSARQVSDQGSVIDGDHEMLDGSSREVGRDVERENERNSARLALFRNSTSFRQAARGVEVRERLASLSAKYPASSADVHEGSRTCIHLSLPRTSSSNARGTGDFHHSEVFRYGSAKYSASGSSLNNSFGRLASLNEREMHETGDQSDVKLSPTLVSSNAASSSRERWITLDLDGVVSRPKTPPPPANSDNPDASSAIPDTQLLLEKSRSGPLYGKQMNEEHRKSGSSWEQRVMRAERGSRSFRGLRSSFSLRIPASEGRAQTFEIEPLATPPALSAPAVDMDSSPTLAQRTMQWLSGGNKPTRDIAATGSLEERNNGLQQIVTE